jgi:hypothetical protein
MSSAENECRGTLLDADSGEELIVMLAVTVEVACQRMTPSHLAALSASVGQAASLPARTSWERKAVAHAQTIGMLGDATGDLVLARAAGHAAGYAYLLALSAGPVRPVNTSADPW